MDVNPPILLCPYCRKQLLWVPFRWFERGCYQCARCGDFPDLQGSGEGHQTGAQIPRRGRYFPEQPTPRPRVLLVDDASEHRDLYALMLESMVSVVTAARVEDALAIAADASLDAIVLDVLTPDTGASDLCVSLKSNPSTARVPVILLISPDDGETTGSVHRAGVAAVLRKPCPFERLVRTLEAVIALPGRVRSPDDHARAPFGASATSSRRSPAILVVDGDDSTLDVVQHALESAGYVVTLARDVATANRLLHVERPNLLIAALRLGDFNGLQFVAMGEPPTPTIILGEDSGDEAESRALGAEYLRKPVDAEALASLVHRMMPSGRSEQARRWARKSITTRVPARLADRPAYLLNVSYGGLCLETDAPPDPALSSVDVTFPTAELRVHVGLAWRNQQNDSWRCGAELAVVTAEWKMFVDAIC